QLKVTASFYPFQYVAEQVGKDLVSVTNLTQPGAEPHDLELSPKQVAELGESDLLVFQKGFQPAVDAAVQTVTPKRTVDTASFLELKPADHEEEHADEHEEDGDEHDHGALDPHTWLDPTNMVTIAEHVRDALTEAMPAAKDTFAANASTLVGELKKLDGDFRTGLTSCTREVFITSHEAFGYLARRYGLEQVGIRGVEPDTEPTAARIAEVQKIAKANQVTTIFFETLVSPAVAQSIAGDLGLTTDVLDPLEGLTDQSRGSDYLEVMRSNLSALRKANGCS
ncbi:MAG TPA: metal ABC transporter substrate-binding protein, partial [Micropruina sp.]|nr:metal ABC transporter substrate-binding protein [Micropruina sp.]